MSARWPPQVESVRAAGPRVRADRPRDRGDRDGRPPRPVPARRRERRLRDLGARARRTEVGDFEAALAAVAPDVALVDSTTFGANAVAEREGLPWAESRPFLLEEPAPGVPPFGFGAAADGGPAGPRPRRFLGALGAYSTSNARLPAANAGRAPPACRGSARSPSPATAPPSPSTSPPLRSNTRGRCRRAC